MTDLEEAVELDTALDWLRRKTSDGPHSARMADTILDALASITRERDEAREENERLRLLILGGEDVPGVAASLSFQQVADAHRSNLDFAADVVAGLTRERDAMREGLRPFAEAARIRLCGEWRDDERIWNTDAASHLTFGHVRRAAALVNGEGGE